MRYILCEGSVNYIQTFWNNRRDSQREKQRAERETHTSRGCFLVFLCCEKLLYLYQKNAFFFHFLFTFSRAHLRAFARAYNITFFLRARAHAREKVTRIAIIDRPLSMIGLSMIVGGRVGALFFIVCFLFYLYEIQIERFCISPPAGKR